MTAKKNRPPHEVWDALEELTLEEEAERVVGLSDPASTPSCRGEGSTRKPFVPGARHWASVSKPTSFARAVMSPLRAGPGSARLRPPRMRFGPSTVAGSCFSPPLSRQP